MLVLPRLDPDLVVIKPSCWPVLSLLQTDSRKILSIGDHAQRVGEAQASERAARRAAMAVLADARADEIEQGLQAVVEPIDYVELRSVETGLVMLRGRIGGEGAPFNLGEATVTRAAVQIASGEVGFAYVLGRDRKKARLSAVCDALWQNRGHRDAVEQRVLAPIRTRVEAERAHRRAETAATRVDFFTLVRGED
jgi:alpha-D-ribose 1-methylphosphonate 5-triphosphate synthase subunit PhnG